MDSYNPKGLREIGPDQRIPVLTYVSGEKDPGIIIACHAPDID